VAELTPEERAIFQKTNAALAELRQKWRAMGLPPEGAAGILLGEFCAVCTTDRGMNVPEIIQDIIDCLESQIVDKAVGQA